MKCLRLIALLTVLASQAPAQDYAFKVLVNKGQNEVKTGTTWQPLKVGVSLKSADELRISQNAYLGLVHVSGKPLEVKDAGVYKVADLGARLKGEGASVLNKYTEFILSKGEQRGNTLTATGAVHRGQEELSIYLPKPQFAIVYNNEISIAWERDARASDYTVQFRSMFGDELEKMKVRDTVLSINLKSSKFEQEDNILVEVTSGTERNKSSETYMIKKLSAADNARIRRQVEEITSQAAEPTALNKLLLAGFYEQNALLIDASTAYQDAIRLEPAVAYYRELYENFLVRNGIKPAAR